MRSRSHLAFGGYAGKQYDPFLANEAAKLPVYDLVGKDTGQLSGGKMFELSETQLHRAELVSIPSGGGAKLAGWYEAPEGGKPPR